MIGESIMSWRAFTEIVTVAPPRTIQLMGDSTTVEFKKKAQHEHLLSIKVGDQMIMDIQRVRTLTTDRLHTNMDDVYEDLKSLIGRQLPRHQIPAMLEKVRPHLRKHLKDERFWDGKLDATHVGTVEVPPMGEQLYIIMLENLETKVKMPAGFDPCTHEEACTIMSKMTKYDWRRIYLEEVK